MRRLASVLSVSLVGFAVVSAPITGRALQEKRDFHISASGPRALADALFDLGRENNWVITYEDPQWLSTQDRVPIFPARTAGAPPLFGIRDSQVDVTYQVERGLPEATKAEAMVGAILNDYRARQGPGEFGVTRAGGLLHVVPKAARNAVNELVPYASPLDKPISWQALVDNGRDTFDGILSAISAAGGRPILMGQPNVRLPHRLVLGELLLEKRTTGRTILSAAIRTYKGQVTWRILCQPGLDPCYFNLRGW